MRDLGDISSVFISLASFLTLISYKTKFSLILRCVFQGENGLGLKRNPLIWKGCWNQVGDPKRQL